VTGLARCISYKALKHSWGLPGATNPEIRLNGDISDFGLNSQVLLKQKDDDDGLLVIKVKDTKQVG
jgi:hypothetical protein